MNNSEALKILLKIIDKYDDAGTSETKKWSKLEEYCSKISTNDLAEEINIRQDERYDENGDVVEEPWINGNGKEITAQFLEEKINNVIGEIQLQFVEWVNQIKIDCKSDKYFLSLFNDSDNYFLSFNYTDTLEKVYDILPDCICHIHGQSSRNREKIYFGGNIQKEKSLKRVSCLSEALPYIGAIGDDDSLFFPQVMINSILRKDVEKILKDNKDKFNRFQDIEAVYTYGFSYGRVDKPYLEEIYKLSPNASWYINAYHQEDYINYQNMLIEIGIPEEKIVCWEIQY
ncbi:AbiH family protein [Lacrimispora sp. 38-1]|uniref:AbiH family protein n=1 Tax=Lacrimispora sp. 38-1 TaxID=3125778 RepID=UPI003CE9B84A